MNNTIKLKEEIEMFRNYMYKTSIFLLEKELPKPFEDLLKYITKTFENLNPKDILEFENFQNECRVQFTKAWSLMTKDEQHYVGDLLEN